MLHQQDMFGCHRFNLACWAQFLISKGIRCSSAVCRKVDESNFPFLIFDFSQCYFWFQLLQLHEKILIRKKSF